jgi:hypothetical protein
MGMRASLDNQTGTRCTEQPLKSDARSEHRDGDPTNHPGSAEIEMRLAAYHRMGCSGQTEHSGHGPTRSCYNGSGMKGIRTDLREL